MEATQIATTSTNEPDIAWVRPAEPIRGLDHLGVQAPCVSLYSQLLPGITNVTDRARYYSFHPWLLWSFERRYQDHSLDAFRRVLRRAECLFALIAIRHSRVVGDEDEGRHGAGMVGRFNLLRIGTDEQSIELDEYATLEGAKRYFKNKTGGLGQYYFGPLRDLRILDHSPDGIGHPPGYDRDRGRALAECFAHGVPEKAFFSLLESDSLRWSDLDSLTAFCPCGLRDNQPEHELLLDVFLGRSEIYRAENGDRRRASLGLMLDLAGRGTIGEGYGFEGLMRGSAYSGALIDGQPWAVSDNLLQARRGWGTYQRNELLSVAVQGLFAALLRAIEEDHDGAIRDTSESAIIGESLVSSLGPFLRKSVDEAVSQVALELPPCEKWTDDLHELQLGWRLAGSNSAKLHATEQASTSLRLLLALMARGVSELPYQDFELNPDHFDSRDIHLASLRRTWLNTWTQMNVGELVQWLSVHWCIGRHLRVALRKLRAERRDTFRIRPLDGELRVVEAPPPSFTAPRIENASQILRDLGLTELDQGNAVTLTPRGRHELEAIVGK